MKEVTAQSVSGENVDIQIADVVAVEKRVFSGKKTALLGGGTYLIYVLAAIGAASAALAGGL